MCQIKGATLNATKTTSCPSSCDDDGIIKMTQIEIENSGKFLRTSPPLM